MFIKKINRHRSTLFVFLSLGLFLLPLSIIYANDIHLLQWEEVTFTDQNKFQLVGTYYPGTDKKGVLLFEGFSSDQMALKNIASEFNKIGYHVFSFDFSGHGRSGGTITFDNAETDRLAKQSIQALETFKSKATLQTDEIIFLGHSMGARVALQTATMIEEIPAGLILLGASINLDVNVQASFFTGADDTKIEWIQNLNASNPQTNILLMTGALDDVLPPSSAQLLLDKLNEDAGGIPTFERELIVVEHTFHNFEIYTGVMLAKAKTWSSQQLDTSPTTYQATITQTRVLCWLVALVGLFLSVISFSRRISTRYPNLSKKPTTMSFTNLRVFFISKVLLWLIALPVTIILFGMFFFIPLGQPVFNMIYVGFIGSYGIVCMVLYLLKKMPGITGNLDLGYLNFIYRIENVKNFITKRSVLYSLLYIVTMIISVTLYMRTGINYIFPLNTRFIWLIVFSLISAIGMYVGLTEIITLLQHYPYRPSYILSAIIIGLTPFFLLTAFYYVLGSTSGFISSIQGLVILGFAYLSGETVQRMSQNKWLTSFYQAFIIFWLLMPQGALFAF